MTDNLTHELETLIDRHGARHVLACFADIAYGKAEHLQSNWQDKQSARNWNNLGKRLYSLVDWSRAVMSM